MLPAQIDLTVEKLLTIFRRKLYRVPERPVEVYPFGIRAKDPTPNVFNDVVGLLYSEDNGIWTFRQYKATTDPGTYWLKNPQRVEGTLILREGQYLNSHMIGKHRGQYEALVQIAPVTVFRDANKDNVFDLDPRSLRRGVYGVNIHRANAVQESTQVEKWSAGCQVIANPLDFGEFMALCGESARRHGNRFSYTLFNEMDFLDPPR